MSDIRNRREVEPGVYQCGCRWERTVQFGDTLRECAIHETATDAATRKFARKAGVM